MPPRKRTYRESGRARRLALRAASFRNNLTGRGVAAQLWAEFRAVRGSGGVEWKRLQRLGREAAGPRSTRHVSSFGTLRRRRDGRRVAATQLLHARWKRMAAKSKASVVSHVAAGAASLSADRGMRRAQRRISGHCLPTFQFCVVASKGGTAPSFAASVGSGRGEGAGSLQERRGVQRQQHSQKTELT